MNMTLREIRERNNALQDADQRTDQIVQLFNKQAQLTLSMRQDILDTISTMLEVLMLRDPKVTVKNLKDFPSEMSVPETAEVVSAIEKLGTDLKPEEQKEVDFKPVVDELSKLLSAIDKLPTEFPTMPTMPTEIEVSNLQDMLDKFDDIKKTLNKLEPVVNVTPTPVMVEAPDLKVIESGLKKLNESFGSIELPKTDLTKVEKLLKDSNDKLQKLLEKRWGGGSSSAGHSTPYTLNGNARYVELNSDGSIPVGSADATKNYSLIQFDDTSSAVYEYYAYMDKDANWFIKRLTIATNLFEFTSPVVTTYATGWANRAGLAYLSRSDAF